jgi:beta-lactamase class D
MISRRTLIAALAAGTASAAAGISTARAEPRVELKPELADLFGASGTRGTIAVLDIAHNRLVMTDETRARQGLLPASTFKMPHSLIALETGVVADVDQELIRWDGVERDVPEWNRDHTLRSAIKFSVVPVYQQIARRIGAERMQHFLDAFDYGNRDIGGAEIDQFWLRGNLRISPLQQIGFLQRLYAGDLPVSRQSLASVKDIVPVEKTETAIIRAKTGTIIVDDKPTIGWLVGWAEHGGDVAVFALNLDIHAQPDLARRMPIAKSALQAIGAV